MGNSTGGYMHGNKIKVVLTERKASLAEAPQGLAQLQSPCWAHRQDGSRLIHRLKSSLVLGRPRRPHPNEPDCLDR